jgi:hypothetical protein
VTPGRLAESCHYLAGMGSPAQHETTGSTFAAVRLRAKVTKGPGGRTARIAITCKLIQAAQGCHKHAQRLEAKRPGRCGKTR